MIKKLSSILGFFLFLTSSSWSMIEIDITEGNREPLPIAITEFFYDESVQELLEEVSSNMRTVISADLERSGLFKSIDMNAFIQENKSMHLKPRFEDWRLIKAQGLVTGDLSLDGEKLKVEFRLWDTLDEKEIEA